MKRFFAKKAGALLLAATMLLSTPISIYAAETSDSYITRAEFALLINDMYSLTVEASEGFADLSADHPYSSELLIAKEAGYMVGDNKDKIRPDDILSGAEAAVIINSLLGFDPNKADVQADLDVPQWSKSAASILLDLEMVDESLLSEKRLTSSDAMELLYALSVAQMFSNSPYALTQANLKDDFFNYVNRSYLATAELSQGYPYTMSFSDVNETVQLQQQVILLSILSAEDLEPGSDEWKIQQLYNMYMNNDARTASLSKLKPYFDEIRAITTIDELFAFSEKHNKHFSMMPFYSVAINSDAKVNATKWAAFIVPSSYDLGSRDYYFDNPALEGVQQAYRNYIGKLLKYVGEKENIEERSAAIYKLEKLRAEKDLPQESYIDPNVLYTKTTWDHMLDITKPSGVLTSLGEILDVAKKMNVYCPNPEYVEFIGSFYTQENLPILKDYALLNVLSSASSMLGDDLIDLSDDLQNALIGQAGAKASIQQRAQAFVQNMMMRTFSNLYTEMYADDEVKADVTEMVENIRDKYRERINQLDWMSDETKEQAIIKLDSIKTYISHPDKPVETLSYEVKAIEDGGNLIDLLFSLGELNYKETIETLKKPVNSDFWRAVPTSTVNAYYSPTNNAIIVPAGILQYPFYDSDASWEENLGGIGAIIAHEFTHAFDNSGAQYDKNGTLTNWWTEEDYATFNELATVTAAELSKIPFGTNNVNGAFCTPETIADLGAVSCVTDIADDISDANMTAVMEAWARAWRARMSPEMAAYLLSIDSHAPNKVRTNFVLSQIDEFYDIFGVTQSDDMYIPEENRIQIW